MKVIKYLVAATFLTVSASASASVIEVGAFETGSMNATSAWNDDRLRAYYSDGIGHLDGFMKFDLSAIDDAANIDSMTLTTYHEFGFSNPYQDPEVAIYHVNNDSWNRGGSHPGLDEQLTGIQSGFPGGSYVAYDWVLDVSAFNWMADLSDNLLSLGMRNEKESYSYVYWHGSDNAMYAPKLTITYSDNKNVPAPAPIALLGLALVGLVLRRAKRA